MWSVKQWGLKPVNRVNASYPTAEARGVYGVTTISEEVLVGAALLFGVLLRLTGISVHRSAMHLPRAVVTQEVRTVQARRGWQPVRTLRHDVGSTGTATLLTHSPS